MSGVIAVGVDGSPQSWSAVSWALEEAVAHGDEVLLVHAWEFPAILTISYGGPTLPVFGRGDVQRLSAQLLEKTADEARREAPALRIRTQLVEGHPASALSEAASGARLLVIGSRGLGGFRGMLMGSVSAACAHHARCPTVIVPPACRKQNAAPGG
jgi:nucleotide-binding universal stress UspA family protein